MVMDETIINGVEFVDVVYHLAASIAHKFLDECVSAKGNTQANVALSGKGGLCNHVLQRCEQVCIIWKEPFGSCVGVDRRDAFCQDLDLEHVELEASVLHKNLFEVN